MTRFVFLADTHLGANPMGYQQQRGYPEKLDELLPLLDRWIRNDGRIDFVLHGGDMIDDCRDDWIRTADEAFALSVPVYLCLGNHDLTRPDAVARWMHEAPRFFPTRSPHFDIVRDDTVIHVVPNHWNEHPYFWKDIQAPRLSADQVERVRSVVSTHERMPHLFCTHTEILGIAPDQTGFAEPYHASNPAFGETVLDLGATHPQIRAFLTGHNHVNSLTQVDGAIVLSAPAFSEVPFEFKLIEIDDTNLTVSTHNLYKDIAFPTHYNFDSTYVQGRKRDRQCTLSFQ